MARVLAIVPDLMLASRVQESLGAAGHEVSIAGSVPSSVEADLLVCDLDAVDASEAAQASVPTLGFYSHVEAETKRRAEAAGFDLAVPRSRMARELPELVDRLLGES